MAAPHKARDALVSLLSWLLLLALVAAVVVHWRGPPPPAQQPPAAERTAPVSPPLEPAAPRSPPVVADRPPPPPPPAQPGAEVEISLAEEPAPLLHADARVASDDHYRAVLRAIAGPEALFSGDLGRAAREFVHTASLLGRPPPAEIRDFLLRGAGAVAGDTSFQYARMSQDSDAALRRTVRAALADALQGDGPLVVGIGEVYEMGGPRHIGVVATRMPIALAPLRRQVAAGQTAAVQGRLLVPARRLKALVLGPDGSIREAAVSPDHGAAGTTVSAAIAVGDAAGAVDVQLVGELPRGPGKLVQVQLHVATPLPATARFRLPGDERGLRDAQAATALAWQLLQDDRRRHGAAPLQWDAALATVAEDHSRDMRDANFFAHRSPTTGLHDDRLARAGYRAVRSAENLAHNGSIAEAERGLMASLGHRRNILARDVTHAGVGVVGEERPDGSRRWWVTQLFALPQRAIDAAAEAARLQDEIVRARRAAGQADADVEAGLSELARRCAADASRGPLEGLGDSCLALARDRGLIGAGLRYQAMRLPSIEQWQLPEVVLRPEIRRFGLGVAQGGDGALDIGVVIVAGP